MNAARPSARHTSFVLAFLALAFASRIGAAVDRVRDDGPIDFGAADLEAALRGRESPPRIALSGLPP